MFKLGDKKLVYYHFVVFMIFWVINMILIYSSDQFYSVDDSNPGLKFLHSFYITVTTHTTTGYGDITPMHWVAKMVVMFHQICVYLLTAGIIVDSITELTLGNIKEPLDEIKKNLLKVDSITDSTLENIKEPLNQIKNNLIKANNIKIGTKFL